MLKNFERAAKIELQSMPPKKLFQNYSPKLLQNKKQPKPLCVWRLIGRIWTNGPATDKPYFAK